MTTTQLLALLPASYAEHNNDNTVYNTDWHHHNWDDYSIEILESWAFEVRHTGATVEFYNIEDMLEYIEA